MSVVFETFIAFFLMETASNLNILLSKYSDFGCGFLFFGCFSKACNVFVLCLMVVLGFIYLQFSGKRKGVCSCNDKTRIDGSKKLYFENGTTKILGRNGGGDQKFEEIHEVVSFNGGFNDNVGGNVDECLEDQVFDVINLRKMVKGERKRANIAHSELEKERMAAASAVDEAMAMILRLQNEKSVLHMQLNQLQRVSEEKQLHDQEIIQSLLWIVMKHESERSLLNDQLRMCREKLKMFMKGEEWDQFDTIYPTPSASYSSLEESGVGNLTVGALDSKASPM